MDVLIDCMYFVQVMIEHDSVSEWLRRWTRNSLGSARVGSNPIAVDFCLEVAGWFRGGGVYAGVEQCDADVNLL